MGFFFLGGGGGVVTLKTFLKIWLQKIKKKNDHSISATLLKSIQICAGFYSSVHNGLNIYINQEREKPTKIPNSQGKYLYVFCIFIVDAKLNTCKAYWH